MSNPYFIREGSGSIHQIFPGVHLRSTTGDQLTLALVRLDEGAVVERHQHPHEQMGYLISGRLEFEVGGETQILNPGDVWRIPSNVPHRVVAIGGPAVAVDVFHPVRDDYR
jgi:quercetin dioxygenase-like cupin family protein